MFNPADTLKPMKATTNFGASVKAAMSHMDDDTLLKFGHATVDRGMRATLEKNMSDMICYAEILNIIMAECIARNLMDADEGNHHIANGKAIIAAHQAA
jgi:hypothetical protein